MPRWAKVSGVIVGVGVLLGAGLMIFGGHYGGGTGRESPDEQAQALAFVDCMRDNGFDMPDPSAGQEGLMDALREARGGHDQTTVNEDFEKAYAACKDLLPQQEHGDGQGPDEEAMLKLAKCLREQGLDVPDDLWRGDGMHDIDEDELRAAMEKCRKETGVERGGHG